MSATLEHIVFVYVKKGVKTKVLVFSDALEQEKALKEDGYTLTATLHAATFLQSLLNERDEALDKLRSIGGEPEQPKFIYKSNE